MHQLQLKRKTGYAPGKRYNTRQLAVDRINELQELAQAAHAPIPSFNIVEL